MSFYLCGLEIDIAWNRKYFSTRIRIPKSIPNCENSFVTIFCWNFFVVQWFINLSMYNRPANSDFPSSYPGGIVVSFFPPSIKPPPPSSCDWTASVFLSGRGGRLHLHRSHRASEHLISNHLDRAPSDQLFYLCFLFVYIFPSLHAASLATLRWCKTRVDNSCSIDKGRERLMGPAISLNLISLGKKRIYCAHVSVLRSQLGSSFVCLFPSFLRSSVCSHSKKRRRL